MVGSRHMDKWRRLPAGARVGVVAIGWMCYFAVIVRLLAADLGTRGLTIISGMCLLPAALSVWLEWRAQPRGGSAEQRMAFTRALRTGKAPNGIDPCHWRRWTKRSRIAAEVWAPLVFIYGLVGVAASLRAALEPAVWLFLLLTIFGYVGVLRVSRRPRRPAAEVQRRQPVSRTERAFHQSVAQVAIGVAIVMFAGGFAILLTTDYLDSLTGPSRGLHVQWAATWAMTVSLTLAISNSVEQYFLRRGFASFGEYDTYLRALRTGELPERVEPDRWRRWLRATRSTVWLAGLYLTVLTLASVSPVLARQPGHHWVTAVALQLFVGWNLLRWLVLRNAVSRVEHLVGQRALRQLWG